MSESSANESNYNKLLKTINEAEYPDMPEELITHYLKNRDEMGFDPALDEATFVDDRKSEWLYDKKSDDVMTAFEKGDITSTHAKQLTEEVLRPLFIGNRRAENVPILNEAPDEQDGFTLERAIAATKAHGFYFAENALDERTLKRLQLEAKRLPYKLGDHTKTPINAGKANEVTQQHERYYTRYNEKNPSVLTLEAGLVIKGLTKSVRAMDNYPELKNWQANEIGYQRYRGDSDYISAHRDRSSDRLLSVTFTITGSSIIRILKTLGDPNDYSSVEPIESFTTSPGSVMFLRAPDELGNGEQVLHDVSPPFDGSRSILNLRMRESILPPPAARPIKR